jgi:hypothetical protein
MQRKSVGVRTALCYEGTCTSSVSRVLEVLANATPSAELQIDEKFDQIINHIKKNKSGGSILGRKKRLNRMPSAWPFQYLGEQHPWFSISPQQPIYGDADFRDIFGLPRKVFQVVLERCQPDLVCGAAADGRVPVSPTMQLLTTLRLLRTGMAAKQLDDAAGIAPSTILQKFRVVVRSICVRLAPDFLPSTARTDDLNAELKRNEARGFPGCIGSLDCMHVRWAKCPKRYQPQYQGRSKYCSIVIEAVAHQSLLCTHLFVGRPGAENDINVLGMSPLWHNASSGLTMQHSFTVNNQQFNTSYFLVDGIYPNYAIFAKPIHMPATAAEKLYTARQESARKDVERLFGVVQGRWRSVRSGANRFEFGDTATICDVVTACFVLHNMIVHTQQLPTHTTMDRMGDTMTPQAVVEEFVDETAGNQDVSADESAGTMKSAWISRLISMSDSITSQATHQRLKNALIEHNAKI